MHCRLFGTPTRFAASQDSSLTFVGRRAGLIFYRPPGRLLKVIEATARFIRSAGQTAAAEVCRRREHRPWPGFRVTITFLSVPVALPLKTLTP
jgi:hypothetical protein